METLSLIAGFDFLLPSLSLSRHKLFTRCHDPLPVGIFLAAGEFRGSQESKATEGQCNAEYKSTLINDLPLFKLQHELNLTEAQRKISKSDFERNRVFGLMFSHATILLLPVSTTENSMPI